MSEPARQHGSRPATPGLIPTLGIFSAVMVVFVVFGLIYLVMTLCNDVAAYRKAIVAGQPALMNSALGAALVLSGTPIYFYYGRKKMRTGTSSG